MSDQSPSAYVSSRRFGEATVTVISEGVLMGKVGLPNPEAEWRPGIPEADADGVIPYGLNLLHIKIGDASILVDPSGLDDPTAEMDVKFTSHYPGYYATPGLDAGLASIGVTPDEITHVLITHAHLDHFRGMITEQEGQIVARFPNARYFVGRGDWDGSRSGEDGELTLCYGTIERLGLLEIVDRDREIVPGVTMIPAPGESRGHCIIRVHSAGESFYYLGDLFHYAVEFEHLDWMDPGREPVPMRASRDRLLAETADSDAILVYTHSAFPGWGRILSAGTGYRWQYI